MEPMDTSAARLLEELGNLLPRKDNTAKIEVNAGSIGVWLAATACAVCVAVMVIGGIFVTREFVRYDQQLQELREKDDIHDAWLQTLNNNKQDRQK